MIAFLLAAILSIEEFDQIPTDTSVIVSTKKIEFENFPRAFNPSLIKDGDNYLLTFRYCPDPIFSDYMSYIGIAELDPNFELLSQPELLDTRAALNDIPSQSEDARIISLRNRLFLIYNDNPDVCAPDRGYLERRDMFIVELFENPFRISFPLKLFCKNKQDTLWQKNWVPIIWNQYLLMTYSIDPHEILSVNTLTGECFTSYTTEPSHVWSLGPLRGGTPAQLFEGEYLSFFHSSISIPPESYNDLNAWFYFLGAYTFSSTPPFQVTKMTPAPLSYEGLYNPQAYGKKVIFPGGFVDAGEFIYLAYGKDDCEMWIATLDKAALKRALRPIKSQN